MHFEKRVRLGRILDLPGASGNSVTSTTGSSSLPPQLFFVVRGTSLTLRTSALSTASANLTLTASPSGVTLTTSFNASAGSISAINLPSAEDTTFALTYIAPGRLDIDVITVQAQDASQTSLTTTPFPTSSTLPSFIIPGLAQPVGTIVGESLAGFFGLILLGAAVYELTRWRRRRRRSMSAGAMEMRRRKGKAREPNPFPTPAPEP
ncbi:hypothetical protein OF83DRAFT_1167293 [Amylostereum chailletii]|nr:hypothetical protein OF83DRAFT_1167293 [Amylostereum chailletii]